LFIWLPHCWFTLELIFAFPPALNPDALKLDWQIVTVQLFLEFVSWNTWLLLGSHPGAKHTAGSAPVKYGGWSP
jgi:hypothetical protein